MHSWVIIFTAFLNVAILPTISAQNNSETSFCGQWPADLQTVDDCCVIPSDRDWRVDDFCADLINREFNTSTTTPPTTTTTKSTTHKPLTTIIPRNMTKPVNAKLEALEECYLQTTKLVEDGKFNKDVAIKIYKNNSEIYLKLTGEDIWSSIVESAVAACLTSNTSTNISENVDGFFNCTNEHLKRNCPPNAIDSRDDCDLTEQHYLVCRNETPKCDQWPMRVVYPEFCCITPELISSNLSNQCRSGECNDTDTERDYAKCVLDCISTSLDIRQGENINFEAVKMILMENARKNVDWNSSIVNAVESCNVLEQEFDASSNQNIVVNTLKTCLHYSLSDNCKEFRDKDTRCNKIKRFLNQCPNTKPNRKYFASPTQSTQTDNKVSDQNGDDQDYGQDSE